MKKSEEVPGESIWAAWYRVPIPVSYLSSDERNTVTFANPEDDTRHPMVMFSESAFIEELKVKDYLTYKEFKRVLCFYKRKCANCDETYLEALDFHHRDSKDKHFSISQYYHYQGRPGKWDKPLGVLALFDEIDKCDVLCANCHRKETHGDRRSVWENGGLNLWEEDC